jgi:hypothetical protein
MTKLWLAAEEKQEIRAKARAKALAENPGASVRITVKDETDDGGTPRVRTILLKKIGAVGHQKPK